MKGGATVTEQRGHVEEALREYAEAGVPEGEIPRAEIRERAVAGRRAGFGRARPSRPGGFLPRTGAGWAFAALLTLLFATAAYAASEVAYDLFRQEMPALAGSEDPGVLLAERQVKDGAAVTLERAYADENFVSFSFAIDDLRNDRRVGGHPAELQPGLLSPTRLTDESGTGFEFGGGTGTTGSSLDVDEDAAPNVVTFAPREKLRPGSEHRFRLEIPVEEQIPGGLPRDVPGDTRPEPIGEPFVFEFDILVRAVPVVEANQRVAVNGLTVTLDRIENSPGMPHAVLCIEQPDDDHEWYPTVKKSGFTWGEPHDGYLQPLELGRKPGEGCGAYRLPERSDGYSLTVTELVGYPKPGTEPDGPYDEKKVEGPWRFRVEVPEP